MIFLPHSEGFLILARWLMFMSTVTLLGLFGLACFVFPFSRPETPVLLRRLRLSAIGGCLLLMGAATADIAMRCCCASGSMSRACMLFCPMLELTHMGHLWMFRMGLCIVLLLSMIGGRSWMRGVQGILALLLGGCLSLSSHAADQGNFSLHLVMDMIHAMSAGLWLGGLFCLAFLLWLEPMAMSADYLAETIPRFSTMAGICLGTLMIGGLYNTWVSLPSLSSFLTTPYGRLLSLKLIIFGVLTCCGAMNRYRIVPQVRRLEAGSSALFGKWIRREVWLGLLVLGITAVLSETMPPHSTTHHHQEISEQPTP